MMKYILSSFCLFFLLSMNGQKLIPIKAKVIREGIRLNFYNNQQLPVKIPQVEFRVNKEYLIDSNYFVVNNDTLMFMFYEIIIDEEFNNRYKLDSATRIDFKYSDLVLKPKNKSYQYLLLPGEIRLQNIKYIKIYYNSNLLGIATLKK